MIHSIMSALAGAVNTVAGYFRLKSCANVQRREAEQDVESAARKAEERRAEIESAVFGNDDPRVNRILSEIIAPAWALFFGAFVTIVGCRSTSQDLIVYIPTDRRIETVTNSAGIVCKAVPNAVMAEMLEKIQELKDLKTELKVDKRVEAK